MQGKHRGAYGDLLQAMAIEPASSIIKVEVNKTRELLRNAVNRAPFVDVKCQWAEGHGEANSVPSGPEVVSPSNN